MSSLNNSKIMKNVKSVELSGKADTVRDDGFHTFTNYQLFKNKTRDDKNQTGKFQFYFFDTNSTLSYLQG